jgi:flavorubredoxin
VYASMYGHTQTMAESVARGLAQGGIEQIRLHNISRTHVSFILPDIWRFLGLILGSCTYNTRLFPPMDMLLSILENDRLVGKTLGVFGTYSWSGGAVKRLEEFARASGNPLVEPVVEARHSASEGQLETCRTLGRSLAEKIHG